MWPAFLPLLQYLKPENFSKNNWGEHSGMRKAGVFCGWPTLVLKISFSGFQNPSNWFLKCHLMVFKIPPTGFENPLGWFSKFLDGRKAFYGAGFGGVLDINSICRYHNDGAA
ncbi:hypothetical protein [Herbaspirillum seropedicae]|uniref:hypothetical protein n=1 Tax=Herbaspirillum seropedicae TaxID=964 RepID=UPI0008638FA7|nr:hypothetical protein [Herbaspirillum seropedicae]AON53135.1 hypothetical protein Hsc_0831 [Herbaspirillum seropedicae]